MDHIGSILQPPAGQKIVNQEENTFHLDLDTIDMQDTEQISAGTTELKKMIYHMQEQLNTMLSLIESGIPLPTAVKPILNNTEDDSNAIEGVFNGEAMIGEDGNTYTIPPNYASKSKLIEGDLLKVTVDPTGRYIFKQIMKTARKLVKGSLIKGNDEHKWQVLVDGRIYKVLTAAVTFHKGIEGAEVTLIIPENGESDWGSIERIIS
ncbi:hypothetical protein KKG22_01040 [Patescibacteria group bacterium]|nr:hypothetical protein [Patescibacteria group bacterium]MBU1722021.1 hypothetical protein [Patescibacteria group bacterium]MBU1901229.1 hypothetical protein [Patescibacteria group bacterium]